MKTRLDSGEQQRVAVSSTDMAAKAELQAKVGKYEERVKTLEADKKGLEAKLAQETRERLAIQQAQEQEAEEQRRENDALQTLLTHSEEKVADYEKNFVRRSDVEAELATLKTAVSRAQEESARVQRRATESPSQSVELLKVALRKTCLEPTCRLQPREGEAR